MIGFQLGREFKLSIAELLTIFPMGEVVYFNRDILILSPLLTSPQGEEEFKKLVLKKAKTLGGCIKIIDFKYPSPPSGTLPLQGGPGAFPLQEKEVMNFILEKAEYCEGKFKYGVSIFGEKSNLKKILMNIKKNLRENKISSRFVNKDFTNLSSAQIIGENLVERGTDFTLIIDQNPSPYVSLQVLPLTSKEEIKGNHNLNYIGETIWVQDIKSYSERDYSKQRDMQVGMLPPKLSQIMINLSSFQNPSPYTSFQVLSLPQQLRGYPLTSKEEINHIIYDPFVGLGTILIESVYMGNKEVYGTDLSDSMVKTSDDNLKKLQNTFDFEYNIGKLNAKFIEESEFLQKVDSIVTEGYLGEIMTKKNISIDRIKKQRESLTKIYEAFFAGLKKVDFKGNIVICFPFWEIKGKYTYFNEIYDILDKYCNILKLLPKEIDIQTTKGGSLLYKRPNQLVGREIFKLTIK